MDEMGREYRGPALRIEILGKEEEWSDPVTRDSGQRSGSVESIPSRAGVGEGDDGTSRSSKGAWGRALVSVVCSTATVSGGGVNFIGLGGVNATCAGVKR